MKDSSSSDVSASAITPLEVAEEFRKSEREALDTAQRIEKRLSLGMDFGSDRLLAAHYRKNAAYYAERAAAVESVALLSSDRAVQPESESLERRLLELAFGFHVGVEGEYGCPGATCPGVQRLVERFRGLIGVGRFHYKPEADPFDIREAIQRAEERTEPLYHCEKCQMALPGRLMTFGIGVRGGDASWCAACRPQPGDEGQTKRAEVIALRKAAWVAPGQVKR